MKAAGVATAISGNDEWITNKESPDPEVLPNLPGYHVLIRPVSIREKLKEVYYFQINLKMMLDT